MIKFTAMILLASVCLAGVSCDDMPELEEDSQSALQPTDSEELAGLADKQQIFSDFCLRSRDYVVDDMKRTTNNLAAGVFSLFFRSAEELGLESLEAQKDATERLAGQLRNPSQELPEGAAENDVVENGKRAIANQSTPVGFFQAITSTLAAIRNTVASGLTTRIQNMRKNFGMAKAAGALVESCSKVAQYEEELRSRFAQEIESIAAKDPSMANMQLDQVECLTSRRILKIEGLCKFARIARGPLMKILTYSS